MKRFRIRLLVLIGLLLPAILLAAGKEGEAGTVKGTVTIGGRPTSDVVVSIEGLPEKDLHSRRAVMDQRDKKFIPHILPVTVGTTVDFPNNDRSWHNVFARSQAKTFNLGLYPPGASRSVTFDKPGVVRILCNVHPDMEAYIVVKGHSHFTVPDAKGNYRFDSVPLGVYRLEVWHPELGKRVEPFHLVREGEVLVIDVDLEGRR